MLHDLDGMMLSRLLGLLLLSSLCSAMKLQSDNSSSAPEPTYTYNMDPGTYTMSPDPPGGNEYPPFPQVPQSSERHWGGGPVQNTSEPNLELCDLFLNGPVPPSAAQIPWQCICQGCGGRPGQKGAKGDPGYPGSPGSPGRRGLTGFRGRPGFVGPPGIKGQKGDDGQKGSIGLNGFSGTKGGRGFKGEKGDRGSEGTKGDEGPVGPEGVCPDACAIASVIKGDPGRPGPPGSRGIQGIKGSTGPKGDWGVKGDQGPAGVPGLDGDKGDQGEEGECNCTDGVNGTKGESGSVGIKGDPGDRGPQGVPGLTGDKGDGGQSGLPGIPGPCSPAIQSAFSAALDVPYPAPNLPIPFSRVLINILGNYNPLRGVYTAPVNGTYVFSYNAAVLTRPLKLGLFLNFNPVVRTTEATSTGSISQQVVLHLYRGNQVWLQVKDEQNNGLYTDAESSSTFSGYLLHPDSCDIVFTRTFTPDVPGVYTWDGDKTTTTMPTTTTMSP